MAILIIGLSGLQAGWAPKPVPLLSPWGAQLNPDSVLQEYPRPQLQRSSYLNLNGLWQFTSAQAGDPVPFNQSLPDSILVPFPIESALSGIMQSTDYAYYRRLFHLPSAWRKQRILLHFGAVDWQSKIYINGHLVCTHKGGYDPFTVDITDDVTFDYANELILWVYDPTDKGGQPVGKQSENPQSIWFTAVSGIWQTVWLEAVPRVYMTSLTLIPDIDAQCLHVKVELNDSTSAAQITVTAFADSLPVAQAQRYGGGGICLSIPNVQLWSPEHPFLYGLRLVLKNTQGISDTVHSYFAMRKIGLLKDEKGRPRLALNNKIYFQFGPLDQGYWPGGLYTAPSDEALKYDIQECKRLGFNMIRKHVKVEPERWYFWCDKLGILVWQDMPNARNRSDADKAEFKEELAAMVRHLRNHPSIVVWTIFNENWGRFDTANLVSLVRTLDDSRLINANSGWNINGSDEGLGDINDIHHYEEPQAPVAGSRRAIACGEFGGLWRQVEDHTWTTYDGSGYASGNALANRYVELTHQVQDLIRINGLSAAVYTEITDVEREYAGLLTYDRKVEKCFYLPIYYANQNTIVTAIDKQEVKPPSEIHLLSNYPNPFNGQTTVYFNVTKRSALVLQIFDVRGRIVRTFFRKTLNPGWHRIHVKTDHWSSGVYFCRVIMNGRSMTRKMILMR